MRRLLALAAGLVLLATPVPVSAATTAPVHLEGTLAGGATYLIDVPARWNRTLLLYSHGYVPQGGPNPARNTPSEPVRAALLADGYALAGSSYAATGWAVENALADQIATLDLFAEQVGRARRTVAWGTSMGGMITTGLVERHGDRFAGGLAMCGLEHGAVANFNNTLDPVFAVRTLLAPGSGVPLVRLPDQAAALAAQATLAAAMATAQQTPLGRARIALAAALHNLPAWTDPAQPEPAPDDYETAQRNQYASLQGTVYVGLSWRQQAETRAGGNMSWNIGVDYAAMLARSSIRAEVEALYRQAGADLAADLRTLAGEPRIAADPAAVAYMARYIAFTGRLTDPLLTVHTTGDALVPVQVEQAYARTAARAGRAGQLRQTYVHRAGHCTFTTGEMLAALEALERRIDRGRWPGLDAGLLNDRAAALDPAAAHAYVAYRPAPYPRPFDLAR